nr:putative pleckstrin (PH) domain, reverse transcriptase, RNA-dependent DNA polymerase [Tanacetum cinerariifolium]
LLWLKRFLQELGFKQQRYAFLCDNQSAIHLAKNSMFYKRTKHIDVRYHWIRYAMEDVSSREDFVYLFYLIVDLSGTWCPVVFLPIFGFIRVLVSIVKRRFCFRICVYTVVTHCTLPVISSVYHKHPETFVTCVRTISTAEVFLAAEFPTVHVVEPSPIIITSSSITSFVLALLGLGLNGEDNRAIVPIDQPASLIGHGMIDLPFLMQEGCMCQMKVNIPRTKKTFCKNKARGKHTLRNSPYIMARPWYGFVHSFGRFEASVDQKFNYSVLLGNQLEDYGVLDESLRSRSDNVHLCFLTKPAISASPLADCVLVYGASSAFEVSQAIPTQILALKGLAANFDRSQPRTGHCVLQTDLDSDAFQRYSNLCALNVTPTLEGPSFDVQGSPSGRAKRVAQPVFLNRIFYQDVDRVTGRNNGPRATIMPGKHEAYQPHHARQ